MVGVIEMPKLGGGLSRCTPSPARSTTRRIRTLDGGVELARRPAMTCGHRAADCRFDALAEAPGADPATGPPVILTAGRMVLREDATAVTPHLADFTGCRLVYRPEPNKGVRDMRVFPAAAARAYACGAVLAQG